MTSEEIERYYQDNLSSFQSETMVYLEQIAVEDPNSAQQIYRELLQGADFAFLASQKAVKSKGSSAGERKMGVASKDTAGIEVPDIDIRLERGTDHPSCKAWERVFDFQSEREKRGGADSPGKSKGAH